MGLIWRIEFGRDHLFVIGILTVSAKSRFDRRKNKLETISVCALTLDWYLSCLVLSRFVMTLFTKEERKNEGKKWVMHMLLIRLQSNTARFHRYHAQCTQIVAFHTSCGHRVESAATAKIKKTVSNLLIRWMNAYFSNESSHTLCSVRIAAKARMPISIDVFAVAEASAFHALFQLNPLDGKRVCECIFWSLLVESLCFLIRRRFREYLF